MDDERLAWIRIGLARGLPLRDAWALVRGFGSARALAEAPLALLREPMGAGKARKAHDGLKRVRPHRVLRDAARVEQRVLTPVDAGYPAGRVDPLTDPPAVLFVRGAPLDDRRAVAIVGSRRASAHGLDIARALACELAGVGVSVVSGMALGIDGAAHEGALEVAGDTVAVLGCGLDVPYPAAHIALSERIATSGTLVSEHPPGQRPERWHFLRRNRLIAALSDAVVVVEAGRRSGALSTARHAVDLNRELLAVPGPSRSPTSAGCHDLLRRSAAGLCEHADDVLQAVGWSTDVVRTQVFEPHGPTAILWRRLAVDGAQDVDALCLATGLDAALVSETLTEWELDGHVQRLPGVGFRKRV